MVCLRFMIVVFPDHTHLIVFLVPDRCKDTNIYLVIRHANYILIIFMNINENIRNVRISRKNIN